MSILAIIWITCFVIAAFVSLVARSSSRTFVLASLWSFVVVYCALVFIGHPIIGVSLYDVVFAVVITAALITALRVGLQRARRRDIQGSGHDADV